MSTKEQRRQKKLAKKRSKEVAQRKQQARHRNSLSSIAGQIKVASTGAVVHCKISQGVLDPASKLGSVLICRRMPDRRLACVRILIDGMCLGVKDVDAFTCFPGDINEILENFERVDPLQIASPSRAKKLVESAIAFAEQFDLHPPADYRKVEAIFSGIDAGECSEEFRFGGEDGKPHYINGPHDSPFFRNLVIETLTRTLGEGNFNFTLLGTMSSFAGDEYEYDAYDDYQEYEALEDPELEADIDEDVSGDYVIDR